MLNRTVLANLAATGIGHLAAVIKHRLKRIQYRPALIDGCLAGTGLRLHTQPGPAASGDQTMPETASPQIPDKCAPVLIPVPP